MSDKPQLWICDHAGNKSCPTDCPALKPHVGKIEDCTCIKMSCCWIREMVECIPFTPPATVPVEKLQMLANSFKLKANDSNWGDECRRIFIDTAKQLEALIEKEAKS